MPRLRDLGAQKLIIELQEWPSAPYFSIPSLLWNIPWFLVWKNERKTIPFVSLRKAWICGRYHDIKDNKIVFLNNTRNIVIDYKHWSLFQYEHVPVVVHMLKFLYSKEWRLNFLLYLCRRNWFLLEYRSNKPSFGTTAQVL